MINIKPYTTIKTILIALLLLCLLNLPYGLYQLFRVIFTIGFVLLAIKANEDKKQTELTIFIVLAVLFQPLLKIPLGREIWNILDVVVALGLIVNLFKTSKNETSSNI
ncbi:hypothetical protein FYC62_14985 [Pedobacter aquae]|uniref:Uncharacterized protein n=1 Tax=Pedobacter aquae TaxID=2605747 RepID=A0A5C0VM76_9SPHI|nr:DUF6804 family protein [Pedobacter aquae]QEK52823.1 hypothetical protein FYC62_14985 [Pedobacter aquae]